MQNPPSEWLPAWHHNPIEPDLSADCSPTALFIQLYAGHTVQDDSVRDSVKGFIEIQKYHIGRLSLVNLVGNLVEEIN